MDDPPVTRTTEQARAGSTPHIVRYVLFASVALAVLAMIGVALFY